MKIRVNNDTVRENIEQFKKLVARQFQEEVPSSLQKERTYIAFVNRITGVLHFPELDEDEPLLNSKNWKPIEIRIKGYEREEGVFEAAEEEASWRVFRCDDMQPAAYQVLAETVKTLNVVSKKFQAHLEMENVFRELSGLEIESMPLFPGKDIVHEAWHQANRVQAEELLKDQAPGTFLFRKDEYASVLEDQLQGQLQETIKCITLTFLDEDGKILDKTLVAKNGKWVIYEDDPNLPGPSYPNVYAILEKISPALKAPLLME